MMKCTFKKIAAMILAGMMAANMGAAAFAESESANDSLGDYLNKTLPQILSGENVNILDVIREYASQTIPYYLPTFELYGEYDVSEPIRIHNWDGGEDTEKYLVIVSKNNVMVGSLTAEYVENRVISAFREESIPEINAALALGTEIQLGYSNDCFLVYSQNKMTVVDNPYFVKEAFADELAIDPSLSEAMCTAETAAAAVQARSGSWSVSGVKNVGNRVHPENDLLKEQLGDNSTTEHHLCWAACVACMAMQNKPGSVYTATDIYYLCKSMPGTDKPSETYPHGSSAWIKFALGSVVNIPPVKTTALSSSQVISLLQQSKPIYVSLKKPRPEKPRDLGHAMVLFFYTEINSTSGQYIFMDPSPVDTDGGRVSVQLGASDMKDGSGLKITSRTGTQYESWEKSFYKA